MLAIFIAQLKLCTHFEFATFTFDSDLLKKLKRLGKQDLDFDNSKALEKTEKVAFLYILYLSVSTAIFKLGPHFIPSPCFIPSPVHSPQSIFYTDRFLPPSS